MQVVTFSNNISPFSLLSFFRLVFFWRGASAILDFVVCVCMCVAVPAAVCRPGCFDTTGDIDARGRALQALTANSRTASCEYQQQSPPPTGFVRVRRDLRRLVLMGEWPGGRGRALFSSPSRTAQRWQPHSRTHSGITAADGSPYPVDGQHTEPFFADGATPRLGACANGPALGLPPPLPLAPAQWRSKLPGCRDHSTASPGPSGSVSVTGSACVTGTPAACRSAVTPWVAVNSCTAC